MQNLFRGLGVAVLLMVAGSASAADPAPLKAYNIEKGSVTVSGVSAGAIAVNQIFFAFPETVRGAAMVSTVPFYCSKGDVDTAIYECMGSPPAASTLVPFVKEFAKKGEIGDLNLIKTGKAWVYASDSDSIVVKPATDETVALLKQFMNPSNVKYHIAKGAEHSWPSDTFGAKCDYKGSEGDPFINNCNFDTAGELLKYFYGNLKPRAKKLSGKFVEFSQREFIKNPTSDKNGMDIGGWIYVPKSCEQGASCKLHMFLHGCGMHQQKVGDVVVKKNGLNEWADTNNIIVLYPQAYPSADFSNPYACFDWWGYTDDKFYGREGKQNKVLHNMLLRVSSGGGKSNAAEKANVVKAQQREEQEAKEAAMAAKRVEAERIAAEKKAAKEEAARQRMMAEKAAKAKAAEEAAAARAKAKSTSDSDRDMKAKAAAEEKRNLEAAKKAEQEESRRQKAEEEKAARMKAERERMEAEKAAKAKAAAEAEAQAKAEAEQKAREEAEKKQEKSEGKGFFESLFGS